MYTPLNYEQLNIVDGTRFPSTHYTKNTAAFNYWWRSLYERAISVFDFKMDIRPDALDLLRWSIFVGGVSVFFKHAVYGVINQPCTLGGGYNIFYRPTKAIVTNPAFTKSLELEIGRGCEVVYISPDYCGIASIIDFYAGQLAELSTAVNVAEINAKIPEVFGAGTKASAETLKKIIDKINEGNALQIYDNKIVLDDDKEFPIKNAEFIKDRVNNYILDKLLQDFQSIINNFDSEIGIPTVPYQKKERMVSFESESRISDGSARATVWIDKMNECFNRVNSMFDTNYSVKYRYKGGDNNVNGNNDDSRNVSV